LPFFHEGVAGVPELNLPDGIHPTEEGHRRIAARLAPHLRAVLAGG
jgi:acyl-CoA thioesterase-1